MTTTVIASNITAPTRVLEVANQTYAYRRFGNASGPPLLCLQHFTATLDNWDPAVTDPLASAREIILFDNAGIGRSTGTVPESVAGMTTHALAFLDGLGIERCDVLGFSLGGMIAQQMVLDRPSVFRRMILVATAPRGGDEMIPVRNSYWLAEYLPNAMLVTYPDAGHGSLFQWHESFQHHVSEFLASNSPFAPY